MGCITLLCANSVGKIIQSPIGICNSGAFLSARKQLPAGKSTCEDLFKWASHSYDDRIIADRQSTIQGIEGVLPYIRNETRRGECTFDSGANQVNAGGGIIYTRVSHRIFCWGGGNFFLETSEIAFQAYF